jgi:phospholipase C
MKLVAKSALLICFVTMFVHAQTRSFKHIVVIVQENRTPDNLFQGLCLAPFGTSESCSTTPAPSQYNIQTAAWFDNTAPQGATTPEPVGLANKYDLDHSHLSFTEMCNMTSGACKMDGAAGIQCIPTGAPCPPKPQFKFVSNSTGALNPYLQLATQYGWANYMFQTNQGASFPAHQFIFGGTSAPDANSDAFGIFAAGNPHPVGDVGCIAPSNVRVQLILSDGDGSSFMYPCFEHQTMGDLFGGNISWKYYAPSAGTIWTAPNAIEHICESTGPGGHCTGREWLDHVDLKSADVLRDIGQCNLPSVSWVVPTCENSDHAGCNDGGGPSWVTAIVNAIGNASTCDNGSGYWNDTAILITWDDWGGWYDHHRR